MELASGRFINRELSWLEFNQRVLDEAVNSSTPLLERLKFLAISSSNLDEFYMVRVGSLQSLVRQGTGRPDAAGLTVLQQLQAIGARTARMVAQQYQTFLSVLEPALAEQNFRRIRPTQLNERQLQVLNQVIQQELYPILTPIAIRDDVDFPLVGNLQLQVCVRLAPNPASPDEPRYAVIPTGRGRNRFVTLPTDTGYSYLLLEDAVQLALAKFFPGETILECVPFRVTRNADFELQEDQAADLLAEMVEMLDARKDSSCVRLEIADHASAELVKFLQSRLDVADSQLFRIEGPLDLSAWMRLSDAAGFEALRYDVWTPQPSPRIDPAASLFQTIAEGDVLLYHPYESFEPVVRLVEEAANDPDVLAIKQTLYRTSRNSPIVQALKRAAQTGKAVTAVVELKARFDEQRNIDWARDLERHDVQVVYGVKGLKTHAKALLIVRREPHGIQRYVHFGTGNYNEATSRLYTDCSLLSSNDELGSDATAFFNAITGYSQPIQFRKIEAAPLGLRDRILELIDGEIERRAEGQKAVIMAKLNALVDEQLIDALYRASEAGVRIRLNVRGTCCLRPGVKGLSENIVVTSVIDRFLEHSRLLYFSHGGDELVFLSSADWMPRNLDRRVELLVPVEDRVCKERLISILKLHFQDNVKARVLRPDGRYELVETSGTPIRSQEAMYRRVCEEARAKDEERPTMFEPHRSPAAQSG